MDRVADTLFYPYEQGLIKPATVAFINARFHPALGKLQGSIQLQQYFKPYSRELQETGFTAASDLSFAAESCDAAFVLIPKTMAEARYLAAEAIACLKAGGILACAADNKAGGTRLKDMLSDFGFEDIQEYSKNKARVVWAVKRETKSEVIAESMREGSLQDIENGFVSMPGIFGWNKTDPGSAILTEHLSNDLQGAGADFGCGYGFLARHVLQTCGGVKEFSCIDADYRAVKASRENLKDFADPKLKFFWEDITKPQNVPENLDFIVMNPPFHEGRKADADIGRQFITTAAESLRPGGVLWMVANAQLPYEDVLKKSFQQVHKKYEGRGFKVLVAKR